MDRVSVWLLGFRGDAEADSAANLQRTFGIDHIAARELISSLPQPVKQARAMSRMARTSSVRDESLIAP